MEHESIAFIPYIYKLMNMANIDKFLAEIFSKKIKSGLDKNELKKIERDLFLKDGISIKMAMENFHLFQLHFKNCKVDYKSFGLNCLNEICQIKISKDFVIINILEKSLINTILQNIGDEEARSILLQINNQELTVPDILKTSKVTRTSGYRKIQDLIKNGMIIETAKVLSKSKKISKYKCVFEKIDVKLYENSFWIKVYIRKKDFENSSIMKVLEKC